MELMVFMLQYCILQYKRVYCIKGGVAEVGVVR